MNKCARKGCHSSGYVRYSQRFGYLCKECIDELVWWGIVFVGLNEDDIKWFMSYDKEHQLKRDIENFVRMEFDNLPS